mgnify:CR=1 FL=1
MTQQTVEQLLSELDEARAIAAEDRKPAAMIAATMSKAKLLGLENGQEAHNTTPQPVKVVIETIDARKH